MHFISSRKHAAVPPSRLGAPHAHALALAALSLPGAALAQSAAAPAAAASQPAAATLPTVKVQAAREGEYKVDTVSSPKFTQPLLDTPQTITVITKELAQQQGATTLTEALRNTPGVSTFYVGENGSTSTGDAVFMRGYDASSSIFVDGVRDLGSISRDLFNLEQIEVEKGPAGTDNGRGSPSGSINLVSKRAERGNFAGGALTLGNEHQRRLTIDVNRSLDDTMAARVSLVGQMNAQPGREQVESNRWGVAPSFSAGLGTATRTTLNYLHVEQDNVPDGGVSTIGLPGYTNPDPNLAQGKPVNPRNFYGTVHDYDDVSLDMGTLIVEHDLAPHTVLRNVTRFGSTLQDYLLTSFRMPEAPTADPATWILPRSNPTNKHQINGVAANQTTIATEFATGAVLHSLVGGLEYSYEEQKTKGVTGTGAWPAANLYDPDPDVTGYERELNDAWSNGNTRTASGYVFDTLHFGERVLVTGGVRVDHYQTQYKNIVACGGTGNSATPCPPGADTGTLVPATDLHTSGNLFSWKLGGVFKPTEDSSLYMDYAISQQPPGGANFQLSNSANSAANPNFDPQKAKTFEVGAKWNVIDNALALALALYRTDITNDIESDGGNPPQYFQTGKKRVQGIEIGAVGNITPDWAVNAGFTTMNTSVVSGAPVGNDTSTALNYTPEKAFTSWTAYKLPFGLTLGGGARYSGSLQRGKDSAPGTPAYTQPYWVVDGMLEYPVNRNIDLRLNVYNLFDRDYVAGINKSGYRYMPGAPRYFTVTASMVF